MSAFETDLPFQVEEWDAAGNRALRTLAECVSLENATYVYEAALTDPSNAHSDIAGPAQAPEGFKRRLRGLP